MNRLLFFVVAAGILTYALLNTAASATTPIHVHSTATIQMRNFAFARCVALSFDDVEIVHADANAASRAYAASAQINDTSVSNMDGFFEKWLKKPYPSMQGGDLRIMRCIDFQQSANMAMLPPVSPIRTYDGSTQLLNFALANCFRHAFDNETSRKDASGATTGYIEFGTNSWDDYRLIGDLVKEWLNRLPPNSSANRSQLEKCMDIYHSPELRGAVAFYSDKTVQLLRNFALQRCLALNADSPPAREKENAEADEIAASFSMRADVSDNLFRLAEQWLKHHPKTNMICEDFYESPELMGVVKHYTGFSQVQVLAK